MTEFNDFLDTVFSGTKDLARKTLVGAVRAAEQDARTFLKRAEGDLKAWTIALHEGDLSQEEFENLVQGLKDLAVLAALTEKGIAAARLQKFREGLIDIVVKSAFKVFL
jgi:hypothetical protein